MKRFTSLLIGCSIALAGAVMAQQPDAQPTPEKKNKKGAEQTEAAEAQPEAKGGKGQDKAARQNGAMKEKRAMNNGAADANANAAPKNDRAANNEKGAGKGRKARANAESTNATPAATDATGNAAAGTATPAMKQEQAQRGKKGNKQQRNAKAGMTPMASPAPSAAAASTPAASTSVTSTPAATAPAAIATPAPAAAGATAAASSAVGAQNGQGLVGKSGKKIEAQQVQQIKQEHANFKAQANPQLVPTVTFNQGYRIQGADRWQGPQYEVFRSYRPERHDEAFYRSRYGRVELIGGGYYYYNNNYWYPAWGYSPSEQYYAYDGPIYVGHRAQPWDHVIADVQAELQQLGYYRGEVDGLLGPLTRQALTGYQTDHGLVSTAAIDEPTLDALNLG